MKPIFNEIYETSGNYKAMKDVISCEVTEELNGSYELKLTISVEGLYSNEIAVNTYIWAEPNEDDDIQPFRVYRVTKPINGIFTVYAEHISYWMSGFPVKSFSLTSATAQQALDAIKTNTLYGSDQITFDTDKNTTANYAVVHPKSVRSCLMGEEGSMRQVYGGDWKFDKLTATLLERRGKASNASLLYGKNLTGITYEDNMQNVYTGIVPYWYGTGDEGEDILVELSQNPVVYADNHADFPTEKISVIDFTGDFDEPPTEEQLRTAAQSYITDNGVGKPDISINVSFVPLWQILGMEGSSGLEKVSLGDTVIVSHAKIGVLAEARVVKTVYDVLLERYKSIEIGTVKENLVGKLNGNITSLQSAIKQLQRKKGG